MNENGRGRLIENVIYTFEYYPYFFFSKEKNQKFCNFTYRKKLYSQIYKNRIFPIIKSRRVS